MDNKILLIDLDLPETRPLSRTRSIFTQRNGVFTPIERFKKIYSECELYFFHPNHEYEKIICVQNKNDLFELTNNERDRIVTLYKKIVNKINPQNYHDFQMEIINTLKDKLNYFDTIYTSIELSPLFILIPKISKNKNYFEQQINEDIKILKANKEFKHFKHYNPTKVEGDPDKVFVHKDAKILPCCSFDTRNGTIVIDKNTEIKPSSYISGPVYIGKNCMIDNAMIHGGCVLGNNVRVSGEIENSMINDYSNKHHNGFLGHSILGSWVNFGAGTKNSDLNNNYSSIKLYLYDIIPNNSSLKQTPFDTRSTKFGSIIGDCVKTAIGTLICTGTIIDFGCNIFGENPARYVPPFSWGLRKKSKKINDIEPDEKYKIDNFLEDCKKIFARRRQEPDQFFIDLSKKLFASRGISKNRINLKSFFKRNY